MPIKQNSTEVDMRPYIVTHLTQVIVAIACLLFIIFGWLEWVHIYNNPTRVFETMLQNNLSTSSITRKTTTTSDSTMDKLEQVSFVPSSASRAVVTISEKSGATKSNVESETIGTRTDDYSRYLAIATNQKNASGKNLDYSSVENVWGKSSPETGTPQYFTQAILGLVPFGNLSPQDRGKILELLKSKKAYSVDYAKVTPKRLDGKSALVFPVKIDISAYVQVLQALGKSLGLTGVDDLNPENYKGQPPVDATITVDKLSRQVLEVSYSGQVEYYSGYGLTTPIKLPSKTIPISDLQKKIQNIK